MGHKLGKTAVVQYVIILDMRQQVPVKLLKKRFEEEIPSVWKKTASEHHSHHLLLFFFSLAFLQCTQTSLAFLLSKTFNINCSPTPFPSLKLISFCLHKKFYPRSSFNISKTHRRAITQHDENCVYSFL